MGLAVIESDKHTSGSFIYMYKLSCQKFVYGKVTFICVGEM